MQIAKRMLFLCERYLKATLNDSEETATTVALKTWWHKKLADYFEQVDKQDRRVEVLTKVSFFITV